MTKVMAEAEYTKELDIQDKETEKLLVERQASCIPEHTPEERPQIWKAAYEAGLPLDHLSLSRYRLS